jgi:hypothetical protein
LSPAAYEHLNGHVNEYVDVNANEYVDDYGNENVNVDAYTDDDVVVYAHMDSGDSKLFPSPSLPW